MKVFDLILTLQTFPPEYDVVLSRDAEGNGFGPVFDVTPGLWEDREFQDVNPDDANSVCLWP